VTDRDESAKENLKWPALQNSESLGKGRAPCVPRDTEEVTYRERARSLLPFPGSVLLTANLGPLLRVRGMNPLILGGDYKKGNR